MRNRAAAVVIAFAIGQLPLSAVGLMLIAGLAVHGSSYVLTLYDTFVAMGLSPSLERGVCALLPDERSAARERPSIPDVNPGK